MKTSHGSNILPRDSTTFTMTPDSEIGYDLFRETNEMRDIPQKIVELDSTGFADKLIRLRNLPFRHREARVCRRGAS